MNPLISIVIPTYNRLSVLKRAINSVHLQTYDNWELIIVDNFSDDGTDDYLNMQKDSRLKLYKTHNEGVIAISRNLGVAKATGEYVAFLDSDDWWSPKKLEISLMHLEQGADLVYHDLYLATKKDQRFYISKTHTRQVCSPVFDDLIGNGWAINNSSVVVRRQYLNEVNGLSEERDLVAAEDFDGWVRISRLTNNFKKISDTLGYYWIGGGNTNSSARILKTLAAIEKRYTLAISEQALSVNFYWLYYTKGRANYMLGNYIQAKDNIQIVLKKKIPLLVYIKCKWMQFAIYFNMSKKLQ